MTLEDAKFTTAPPLVFWPIFPISPNNPPPLSLYASALLVGLGSIITFSPDTGSFLEQPKKNEEKQAKYRFFKVKM